MSVFDRLTFANEEFEDGADAVNAEDASEVIVKISEVEDPEAGVVEGEIAEIKEEIDTAERDIEELETKAEAAESYMEAIEAFGKDGGMEPQAAGLIHAQMSGLMAKVGVESFALAAENFDGSAARQRNTEPALEAISDTLKKVWEFIKRIATKVWNFMKDLWSKISFQAQRVKARAVKIQNAANSLKGHSAGDKKIKVGGNSYLYLGNEFVGQGTKGVDAINAFVKVQPQYAQAIAGVAETIKSAAGGAGSDDAAKAEIGKILKSVLTISRTGQRASKAPLSGDRVIKFPTLPGNKTIFVAIPEAKEDNVEGAMKALRGINAIFATDPSSKTTSKTEEVQVSSAQDVSNRMKAVIGALSGYEAERKGIESLTKALKTLSDMTPDNMDKKAAILKVVRQAVTAVRKLAGGTVAGANSHVLSALSAQVSFAARELSALAKDKKKGTKGGDDESK